jgi:membrane protease subunit (stomatin/prohibitin family)
VISAGTFLKEVVGTEGEFTTEQITDQLRNLIVARFADILGESKIPALDLAANYDELGKFITEKIADDFDSYGLQVIKLLVENISLPPEVEAVMDKRTSMGVIGNLQAYTQFQAATAMEKAAEAPGGAAGSGMGLGVGFAMANQMAQTAGRPGSAPPPLPQAAGYFVAVAGRQTGPFDLASLRQQAQAGQLAKDSLVWAEGMAQWTAAGDVAEVAKLFGATPPPVPPKA